MEIILEADYSMDIIMMSHCDLDICAVDLDCLDIGDLLED